MVGETLRLHKGHQKNLLFVPVNKNHDIGIRKFHSNFRSLVFKILAATTIINTTNVIIII